jgi:hypothetical protein
VWAQLDCLYILAQQNQVDAQLNLIGTSYGLTAGGLLKSVAFTPYKGFVFPGVSYLDTNFNATTAVSPHFTQNSANYGVWSYAIVAETVPVMGSGGSGGGSNLYTSYGGTDFYARVNEASASSVPAPGAKGLFSGDRSSSANVVPYWNGVSQGTVTSASLAPYNADFSVGSYGGTASTAQTLSEAHIGASLGSGNLALYNRLRTYMTAVGVP